MFSSQQSPQALVTRIRALADKREEEASGKRKVVAQGLIGAAYGYRALADALERQPSLPWLKNRQQQRTDRVDTAEASLGPEPRERSRV